MPYNQLEAKLVHMLEDLPLIIRDNYLASSYAVRHVDWPNEKLDNARDNL